MDPPEFSNVLSMEAIYEALVVPGMKLLVDLCLVLSVMLFLERLYMGIVIVFVKLLRWKPEKMYKWEAMNKDDTELGNSSYPMVLVQIPMHNEKEVYQLSIGAACGLSWPSDRIIIQVLDDSTDPTIKSLIEEECRKWGSKGINIKYETRENRKGHKAGVLREGMKHTYVKLCDHVAIFDADFQPDPDFLRRTIPFLVHNPEIALVQARWKFEFEPWTSLNLYRPGGIRHIDYNTNALLLLAGLVVNVNECLMTRFQEMSFDYHFSVEQEVGSSTYSFFGFNGTAGVWRIAALNEAGGWRSRTTVEDMDLAVRATLKGWKFVYVGDVKVKNELPSTYATYRKQQYRWSCGPALLFRKMAIEIVKAKKVSVSKKFYLIYRFFFVRKIVAQTVNFFLFSLILPATVFVPAVEIPKWGAVYIPCSIALLNALGTPRSLHLMILWIPFETVMSLHRTKATFMGLLETGRVDEWVVTEKLGDAFKIKPPKDAKKMDLRIGERIHLLELGFGAYLVYCGVYDLAFGKKNYFMFLFLQSIAFFVTGIGYVGT